MNTPARWWAAGMIVLVALGQAAWADAPVIDLSDEDAQGALQDSHRQQIDAFVAHYVDAMGKATTQETVVAARRRLIDNYNRFGTRAQEYMAAFASSMAKHGKDGLAAATGAGRLDALKKINLAIAASRMGQVSLGPLAEAMVSHNDPAVRFFGWDAYVSMRASVLAAGGPPADAMFAGLSDRLEKETDPHVLSQMMRMFTFRGVEEFGGAVSESAYEAGLARFFKALQGNWVGLCQRMLRADGVVAEAISIATDAASKIKGELKEKVDDKALAQMLANMAWSGGKAYDLALTVYEAAKAKADAAKLESGEAVESTTDPAQKARELAKKAGMALEDLPSVTESEHAVSAIAKALRDCEAALNALTGAGKNLIEKELKNGGAAVRIGTLEWIDDVLVKKYGIKKPEEIISPK